MVQMKRWREGEMLGDMGCRRRGVEKGINPSLLNRVITGQVAGTRPRGRPKGDDFLRIMPLRLACYVGCIALVYSYLK